MGSWSALGFFPARRSRYGAPSNHAPWRSPMSLHGTYDPQNIFALIIRGEAPCYKLYEDDDVLAFIDFLKVRPAAGAEAPPPSARDCQHATPATRRACRQRRTPRFRHRERDCPGVRHRRHPATRPRPLVGITAISALATGPRRLLRDRPTSPVAYPIPHGACGRHHIQVRQQHPDRANQPVPVLLTRLGVGRGGTTLYGWGHGPQLRTHEDDHHLHHQPPSLPYGAAHRL